MLNLPHLLSEPYCIAAFQLPLVFELETLQRVIIVSAMLSQLLLCYNKLLSFFSGVLDLAAGSEHSLATTESGEAFSWGNADSGRLGHGKSKSSSIELFDPQRSFVDVKGSEVASLVEMCNM